MESRARHSLRESRCSERDSRACRPALVSSTFILPSFSYLAPCVMAGARCPKSGLFLTYLYLGPDSHSQSHTKQEALQGAVMCSVRSMISFPAFGDRFWTASTVETYLELNSKEHGCGPIICGTCSEQPKNPLHHHCS